MHPEAGRSVRELARRLGRAPSTVSVALAALRDEGVVDSAGRVPDAQLFWRVSDHWTWPRTDLLQVPQLGDVLGVARPLQLGLADLRAPGWALAGDMGAVELGAPLVHRAGHPPLFYVPDRLVLQRALRLLGPASDTGAAACGVIVAPVPAVCAHRVEGESSSWPLAHPVVVALDLAQDSGRGQEILQQWDPDGVRRVW